MLGFIELLVQVFAYLLLRIKMGVPLTLREKQQLLEGLLQVGNEFLLEYKNGSVGTSRLEVPPCNNFLVPKVPF
jgi:hypothetical protein